MKSIFVSSTFRDMQAERDLVQEMVLPHLRNEAKKYGENIDMLDLRWGVNTSELESDEGSRKVMSVCLEEIERSHPYMLIFMGERYGTMMPPKLIKEMVDRKNVPLNLDDYAVSITALEVEYGALSEYGCLDNCIVCFREPVSRKVSDRVEQKTYASESYEATKKLESLKRRIQRELGDRVIFYTAEWSSEKGKLVEFKTAGGQALAEKLGSVFTEMFHEDWEQMANLSQEEREQLAVDAVIENRLKSFNGRDTLLNDLYQKIVSGSGTLILQGCAGSGKTSIMCKIMKRLQQERKTVFRFVSGNTPFSSNAFQLVKQLVTFLEKFLHVRDTFAGEESDNYDFKKWKQRLEELCDRLPRGEKIYVVVDALDQLEADDHAAKMEFVPNCENVRVVASCTDLFDLSKVEIANYQVEELPLLMGDEIQEVVEGLFASLSKNAYAEYIDAIMWKGNSDLPLYLSLIVQRLNMMNSDELYFARSEQEIIQKGVEIIDSMPDDLEKAILLMLKEAEQRVGIRSDILTRIMRLLAVSRNGLRLSDIEMIFKSIDREFSYLDFARLRNYLDMFFVERENGFIDFGHKSVRQAILNSFEDKKYYHRLIGRNMWRLTAGDTFRLQEGLYHIYKSDEYTSLASYLRLSSDIGRHVSIAKEQMCKLVVMDSYGSWFQDAIEHCRKENRNGDVSRIIQYLSEDWTREDYRFLKPLNEYRAKMYEYILAAEDAKDVYKEKCILNLAEYYTSVGDTRAAYYLEKDSEIRKRNYLKSNSEEDLEKMQEAEYRQGEALYEKGEYRKAAERFEELLKQERLSAYVKSSLLNHLGLCYGKLGKKERELECFLQNIELIETEEKQGRKIKSARIKATYYGNAGHVYAECSNFVKAEEYIRKAEKILLPIFEIDKRIVVYSAMAGLHGHWKAFYQFQEKWDMVKVHQERNVAYREVAYQKSGEISFVAELVDEYINLAYVVNKQNDYENGIQNYTKALRLCEKLIEERGNRRDHKLLVRVYRGLCITYRNSGDCVKSRAYGLNWQVEAENLLGKERHEEDVLQCADCYDSLRRTCKELGKKDEALQYCDKAIAMYEELAAKDKSYEKEIATLRESRRTLTVGEVFEKRERCRNPLMDCDFTEGGTVDGMQKLQFVWKTEMWGCHKITIKIVNRKGEIVYSTEGNSTGEYGASPYTYSISAPTERGSYLAKVVWTDIYGYEYAREFAFSVSGTIVKKPNPVKITTSIDDEERFVVSPLRENIIRFKSEISGVAMGILEMKIELFWDESHEKICERIMKSDFDEYGSNPMTYSLKMNVKQSGRIRFEITTMDYWGETTVRKFIKEFVHETGKIYITSMLDTEQVVKSDATILVTSYCSNGDGIRRSRVQLICKETGQEVDRFVAESTQKIGARPFKMNVSLKRKFSAGYYIFRVTSEDVKGNTETKEWLIKVVG